MSDWNPEANEIFLDALDRAEPGERMAFLDAACRGRPELRARVEALLAAHRGAGEFLEAPAVEVAGRTGPTASEDARPRRAISEAATEPLAEALGTLIGPYKLLQQIGEGGMGVVFMAEQEAPVRRRVAVKVIKPGMDSRQVVARFEAERQALALMDHPNIARVFDAGATAAGRPYFVMELVHGVPITEYCDRNLLTPRERLELFVPVCRAVQHAHLKGVIHRDIKPSNVLVTLHDGIPVPKVIDFGVAKATEQRLTEKTLFTQFGTIVGTLEYMSPEQAEMSGLGVDSRSDIYALGVLLYELLTGTTPLERGRAREVAYAELLRIIREEDTPRPSTRVGSSAARLASIAACRRTEPARLARLLEGELDWILLKALEKDRTRRYETAAGLARDVERHLAGEPVEACPPSAAYRLRKFAARHRRGLAITSAFAALLVAGLVAGTLLLVRTLASEKRARDEATRAGRERDRALHAERHAEAEGALVGAMNDFLRHELLEQADPGIHAGFDRPPDRDIKLRTVLDRAAAKIEGAFEDRPEPRAAIRRTIGEAYRGLGEYDLARPHLEAAYEWDRENLGPEHDATLLAQNSLALLCVSTGDYARAESLLLPGLDARLRRLGPDHPETLTARTNLGLAYLMLGRLAEAEAQLAAAHEVRRRVSGPDHPETHIPARILAEVYRRRGRPGEAEPLLVQALDGQRRSLGAKHPRTLATQAELAEVYRAGADLARAEPLLVGAAEGFREVLGPDHPSTITTETNLAGLYKGRGEFARAEALYRRCVDAYRRTLGPEHPGTAVALENLAALYLTRKQFDAAEPLLSQALPVLERKFGPGHPSTLNCQANLAVAYRNLGQVARAEELLRKVLEKRRETLGPDHPETLSSQNNLAVLYGSRGEYDKAETLLDATLAARRAKLGPDHPMTLNSQLNLALLYRDMGDAPRSEATLSENLEARRRKLGPDHPDTLITQGTLAELYQGRGEFARAEPLFAGLVESRCRTLGAGDVQVAAALAQLGLNRLQQRKFADAEPVLRKCLEIRAEKRPDDWATFHVRAMLGRSLLGREKYAEAEPLLLDGYEGMRARADRIPPQARARIVEALEGLVQLYEAWGKPDRATPWKERLEAEPRERGR